MATPHSYTKCLKSNCEIVVVYAGWDPATCTWNKQSSRGVQKNQCSKKPFKI